MTTNTYNFSVRVTDANGLTAVVHDSISVTDTGAGNWYMTRHSGTGNFDRIWRSNGALVWQNIAARSNYLTVSKGMVGTASTLAMLGSNCETATDLSPVGGVLATTQSATVTGDEVLDVAGGVLYTRTDTSGSSTYSYSLNGGLTWSPVSSSFGARELYSIARLASGRWLAFFSPWADFGLFAYSDAVTPTGWVSASNPTATGAPTSKIFAHSTGAFQIGNTKGIRRTTNGTTWTYSAGQYPDNAASSGIRGATDGNGFWLLRSYTQPSPTNRFSISNDNGATWSTVAAPVGSTGNCTQIEYANGVFVAVIGWDVYVTANKGVSWTKATKPTPGAGDQIYIAWAVDSV